MKTLGQAHPQMALLIVHWYVPRSATGTTPTNVLIVSQIIRSKVHVETSATLRESRGPTRLLCPSATIPGRGAEQQPPFQGRHLIYTSQCCHRLLRKGVTRGQPFVSHEIRVQGAAPEEQVDNCIQTQTSVGMPCSTKPMNKLPNWFLK